MIGERCINRPGKKIIQKELQHGVLYSNLKGWCTKEIFQEEIIRFSKFLKKKRPGRKCCLLLDNFSGHKIDLAALEVQNLELVFFRPNCTARHQPADQTLFAALKAKYRTWLMEYRHVNQVPSPSLEIGVKRFLELIMGVSQKILSSSWRRTGIPRFQSFEVFPFKNLLINHF